MVLTKTGLNDAKRKKVRKGDIQRLIGKHIFAYASKEGSRGDQSAGFETSRIEEMQEFRRCAGLIPHHETFSTAIQSPRSSTKG